MQAVQQAGKKYHRYLNDLDNRLYRTLEDVITKPYPLKFEHLAGSSSRTGFNVILQEGPYMTYIAEKPCYAKDGRFFSAELSFLRNGIVEAGWMLDSPAHFFLLYCPLNWNPETGETTSIHALLVAKARLLQELSRRGFDRAALAGRDELLRKSGWAGLYHTADPDIEISFRQAGERNPIFLQIKTPALESIASADFWVPVGDNTEPLRGKWLGKEINFKTKEG